RRGVPAQDLAGGAQPRGDPVVPGEAPAAVRVRGHAAGVRLLAPAGGRDDVVGPGRGALPRPGPGTVDQEERVGGGAVPLRLLSAGAFGVGAQNSGARLVGSGD